MDINTKEILALEVTDEKMHESKVMENLVKYIYTNNLKIKSLIGDGAYYNSNENFKYLNEERIKAIIKEKRILLFHPRRITRYGI